MDNISARPSRGDRVNRTCFSTTLANVLLTELNSPVARSVKRALKNRAFNDVIGASVDPLSYTCPDRFYRDWLAVSLLSKYPEFPLGINTADVALEKFKMAEIKCGATNRRLTSPYETPTMGVSGESLLHGAAYKIRKLLGRFSWDAAEPYMSFSSGASTRLSRAQGDPYYKLQGVPEVTRECAILALCAIERVPNWTAQMRESFGLDPWKWVKVVPGNRITTVPKNAKTDRTIAIEPCMNMFLQKGIGGVIRNRLRCVGINLDSQLTNQEYARIGSLTGSHATLDLSAASDTVAWELVRVLLPPDWVEALDLTRSHRGVLPDGTVIPYRKVSSMGNGFTFELESLIFWALGQTVCDSLEQSDRRCIVYGDDIIVPSAAAGFLIELLEYCGFDLNISKSFMSGPFRESCGKHYFNGIDVTPFYIRTPIKDDLRLIWFANSLRRWSSRPTPGHADLRFKTAYTVAVRAISRSFYRVPRIPDGVGDGALIGTFVECTPRYKRWVFTCPILLESFGSVKPVYDLHAYNRALMRASAGGGLRVKDGTLQYQLHSLLCGGEREPSTCLHVDGNKRRVRRSNLTLTQWVDAPCW